MTQKIKEYPVLFIYIIITILLHIAAFLAISWVKWDVAILFENQKIMVENIGVDYKLINR